MECPKCGTELHINPGYKPYCPNCKEHFRLQ